MLAVIHIIWSFRNDGQTIRQMNFMIAKSMPALGQPAFQMVGVANIVFERQARAGRRARDTAARETCGGSARHCRRRLRQSSLPLRKNWKAPPRFRCAYHCATKQRRG
jgi:hypothetical protein